MLQVSNKLNPKTKLPYKQNDEIKDASQLEDFKEAVGADIVYYLFNNSFLADSSNSPVTTGDVRDPVNLPYFIRNFPCHHLAEATESGVLQPNPPLTVDECANLPHFWAYDPKRPHLKALEVYITDACVYHGAIAAHVTGLRFYAHNPMDHPPTELGVSKDVQDQANKGTLSRKDIEIILNKYNTNLVCMSESGIPDNDFEQLTKDLLLAFLKNEEA